MKMVGMKWEKWIICGMARVEGEELVCKVW